MKKNIKASEKALSYIVIIVITALYFIVNKRMWWYGDDFYYSTNLVTGDNLQSIHDIIESQIWHYNNWGGRTVAHTLLQLLFLTNDKVIDIVNVCCSLLLAFLLSEFMPEKSILSFAAIYSSIFAFTVSPIETLLWQTGVANYLYMSIIQFLFLLIYFREFESSIHPQRAWMCLIIIPLSIITGWSNENMAPAILVGIIAIIIYMTFAHKKCPIWMYIGALGNAVGCYLLITAPGNNIRSEQVSISESPLLNLSYQGSSTLSALFISMQLTLGLTVIAIYIYKVYADLDFLPSDCILLGISILSWGAMLLAAHYPARATFGTVLLFITFSFRLIVRASSQIHRKYIILAFLTVTAMAIHVFVNFCC